VKFVNEADELLCMHIIAFTSEGENNIAMRNLKWKFKLDQYNERAIVGMT